MNEPLIFHVFSTFKAGGPQVRTIALLNWWARRVRHRIMAMDGDTSAASRISGDVDFQVIATPRGGGLRFPFQLRSAILKQRPDLLVTYNWGAIESAFACSLPGGCPVVHIEHGFGAAEAQVRHGRRLMVRRLVLNRVVQTIVPSHTLLEIARNEFGIQPQRLSYVPNGVDTTHFQPGAPNLTLRSSLGIGPDELVFGFVGLLREEKNLPLMIRAFAAAEVPGSRLLIVGDGVMRPELEALKDQLGLGSCVVFAGAAQDPAPYLRAMDCFVLSSMTEQMPMSLLEAMATGLPTLCTDVGDMARIVNCTGQPWVVKSRDSAALAGAMQAIAQQPLWRAEQGVRNRNRAVGTYSFQKMAVSYSRIFGQASKRSEFLALARDATPELESAGLP